MPEKAVVDEPRSRSAVSGDGPIIFFDGMCGLCDRTVDALLRRDRRGVLRFAPLQGPTAAAMLPASDVESLASVVLVDEDGIHRRSDAVVRVLGHLGGHYRLYAAALRAVPSPLRNIGYRLVAKSRYRLFGRKSACRVPTPAECARFLP